MMDYALTPEQEAEAQRTAAIVSAKVHADVLQMARLMASKADQDLLGKTEYQIRDRVHAIGAFTLETALQERKKRGTKGRA